MLFAVNACVRTEIRLKKTVNVKSKCLIKSDQHLFTIVNDYNNRHIT